MKYEVPEIKMAVFEAENILTQVSEFISGSQTYQAAQQAIDATAPSAANIMEFDF